MQPPIDRQNVASGLFRTEKAHPLIEHGVGGFALATIKVLTTKTPSVRV